MDPDDGWDDRVYTCHGKLDHMVESARMVRVDKMPLVPTNTLRNVGAFGYVMLCPECEHDLTGRRP